MNGYVLQREDGKFVTYPGSEHSYTGQLQKARIFPSREAAEQDRCPGNERVMSLSEAFSY